MVNLQLILYKTFISKIFLIVIEKSWKVCNFLLEVYLSGQRLSRRLWVPQDEW